MSNIDSQPKLAILIDADNISHAALPHIMAEVSTYGASIIRRIYGDWTSPSMISWKAPLLAHAFIPIQQYSYTTGKNSTDGAMIIDAMDILYTSDCDSFVLVSSDSDFTHLALRLREAGKTVYGIGEKKTPAPFMVACNQFIYVEVLCAPTAPVAIEPPKSDKKAEKTKKSTEKAEKKAKKAKQEAEKTSKKATKKAAAPKITLKPAQPTPPKSDNSIPDELITHIATIIKNHGTADGYIQLAQLGNYLSKVCPNFKPTTYGHAKLSNFLSATGRFKCEHRKNKRNSNVYYVRDTNA